MLLQLSPLHGQAAQQLNQTSDIPALGCHSCIPSCLRCPWKTLGSFAFLWPVRWRWKNPCRLVAETRPLRCAEGAFNPLSIDVIAQPGQYVAPDGSGVLPCPVGMSCPGGRMDSEDMCRPFVCAMHTPDAPPLSCASL